MARWFRSRLRGVVGAPTEPFEAPGGPANGAGLPSAASGAGAGGDGEPNGFIVDVAAGVRVHFLDWSVATESTPSGPGFLLVHGLSDTAWSWAPVARRLRRVAPVVAMDLRGHGLSDAPTEGYDSGSLSDDVRAVAEGSRLLAVQPAGVTGSGAGEAVVQSAGIQSGREPGLSPGSRQVVLAGHGYGAIVAAWAAASIGDACAALVLVDGGLDDLGLTGIEPGEFERGLAEPPEIYRSMAAFLADREAFDPSTWDADQERAARMTVVEVPAGHVVPAIRPHAFSASVAAMFAYRPADVLAAVTAPVTALVAGTGPDDGDPGHAAAIATIEIARARAGRSQLEVIRWPEAGHNLMRYRPGDVAAALLAASASASAKASRS